MSEELVAALDRLTAEFKRYNDRNDLPLVGKLSESDIGRANYDENQEDRKAREALEEKFKAPVPVRRTPRY